MTTKERKYTVVNGKIIPKYPLSVEEKAKRRAELEELDRRCQLIFERVQPELIKNYYNWFIVIEPDSGDYFIDKDENIAKQKARQKYPHAKKMLLRINETGACGRV
ncbi:MAG: hypothetical protein AB4426_23325 [Xenococcaceae cyanobacterium]